MAAPQVITAPDQSARRRQKYICQMKATAILHLIGGALLVCFGIVAIILLAYWSYFATPIWSGIVIYVLTGGIGLWSSFNKKRSQTAGYITMSIIAALMSCALIVMYSFATVNETRISDSFTWNCVPGEYPYSVILNCAKSESARIAFDSLIAATALYELILSLVSLSITSCFACSCCYSSCKASCGDGCVSCCESCCGDTPNCCSPSSPPTGGVIVNSGAVIASGMQPDGGVTFPGGMENNGQPTALYIVQQTPGQQLALPYPVAPAPIPQQQINMIQPSTHVAPRTTEDQVADSQYAEIDTK